MKKERYTDYKELESMYKEVIDHVSKQMEDNEKDWTERYREYLEVLAPNSVANTRIRRLKELYRINPPLTRYLSVSYAKKALTSNVVFDLRVYGHSIGNLMIKIDKEIGEVLDSKEYDKDSKKKLQGLICKEGISQVVFKETNYSALKKISELLDENDSEQAELVEWISKNTTQKYDWNSEAMTSLRSILIRANKKLSIQSEHSCENLLLKALSLKKGDEKYLKRIQPIQIGDSGFFQMPTCLKGSNAKKSVEEIIYSGEKGGGIDILARITRGNKAELCLLELKDEYLFNERPVLALKQAIAYAVCLDYIIRSKDVNMKASWYNDIFMLNSKSDIADTIRINVVAAMPFDSGVSNINGIDDEDKIFEKKEIEIDVFGHKDILVLHYMFFKKDALKNEGIENGIVTSLPLKHNF